MAILAVIPRLGQPNPASLLATECPSQAKLINPDPEHLRISVETSASCLATIAVAWSPKWAGRLDNEPIRLGRTEEGLLTLPLSAGAHLIAVDFHQDSWDKLGIIISILACLSIVAYGWQRKTFAAPALLEGTRSTGTSARLGAAAGARVAATDVKQWSAGRKKEIVLRVLRGEPVDALSRELSLPIEQIEEWRDRALASMDDGLKER